jgi:DNA-binding CsgD family transcriptional regulator
MVRTGSASRPLRFLGREQELEQIRSGIEAAVDGRGGLLLVTGPPGIGLTSLVREAASRAESSGVAVAWGACLPGTAGRPFSGLADALERYMVSRPGAEIAADLAADAGPILRLCPALSRMVPSLAPAAPLGAADERLRLYEAVAGVLRRLAMRVPLMLVIDDAWNAGVDLVQLLEHLSRRLVDARVVIVCLAPPSPMSPLAAVDVKAAIDVAPLDEGALAAMLADRSAGAVAPAVVSLIADVSAGNPLLAIQLFQLLLEQGATAGGADLPSRDAVPGTLDEVIAWRAAPVIGDARAALETVALIPNGAPPSLVAAVLGFGRSRAIVALEMAAEHGFTDVDSNRGVYLVEQPAVRTAIANLLAGGAAFRLHRAIATGIEEDEPNRLRERAGELCFHWGNSASIGGGQRGVHFALLAAEQARAAYAHRRVVECIDAALALAPESDQALRLDLRGRLAAAQADAGMRDEAVPTATRLMDETRQNAAVPSEVLAAVTDTLRTLRGKGETSDEHSSVEELRLAALKHAARADPLVRTRFVLAGEHWAISSTTGLDTLVWTEEPAAARALLETGHEPDGGEVMLAQRRRTQAETASAVELANRWRRPQSVLRAMECVATDLVWRHGMFREGAARSAEYLATAERYGSHRDRAAAHLLMARARAALGEFEAVDEAIDAATTLMAVIEQSNDLADQVHLSHGALAYYRDGGWSAVDERDATRPAPASLLFAALAALANARLHREAEARSAIGNLLDAIAQQVPLTLYREPALTATLAAAWELGAAEHAGIGRSLLDLAAEGGAGGQIESSLAHAVGRMLSLAGDLPAARDLFANERPTLDRAGQRPLRALVDYDEAIAIAATGKDGYLEATRLLEAAAGQFEQLGMTGWLERTRDLLTQGLDVASTPGGRLSFTYPRGLTRREADVVRLVATGASQEEAAQALVLDVHAVGRLIESALEKLGAEHPDELPRLARRYGLGGV